MVYLFLILWLVGAITAYPRNKKWTKENILIGESDEWTNQEMIQAVITCLIAWWFVWAWFVLEKIPDIDWFTKKARF